MPNFIQIGEMVIGWSIAYRWSATGIKSNFYEVIILINKVMILNIQMLKMHFDHCTSMFIP